ncbi:MAG: winged helix-turn-helix domain-containing protein [Dokdonella sp.]
MDQATASPFTLGDWSVDPVLNSIAREGETIRLEPRTMRLLLCLAERGGGVVSADDLLDYVWPNVIVTPDSVYQAVAALRRLLGDNPKDPRYIVTVPRQGYRMVAAVNPRTPVLAPAVSDAPAVAVPPVESAAADMRRAPSRRALAGFAIIAALALVAVVTMRRWPARDEAAALSSAAVAIADAKSVAVLPFLDLTEAMGEEVFADGMTEELIDKFSQIPGLHVPSPTASFWFKDKQMTVAEIAHKLGVAYLLDGSVRKSGAMLRVAARLVRADDGFVVWTETYDRPSDDKLMIQDDIASEVQKAMKAAIDKDSGATALVH